MFKRKKIQPVSIPIISMADVSFLLLLFFIITSNFDIDSGISLTLPKYSNIKNTVEINRERVLLFYLDNYNEVIFNNQKINFDNVTNLVRNKLKQSINKPENEKAIVSIITSSKSNYESYIKLLDRVKLAYALEREELSRKVYKKSYKDLTKTENSNIRNQIPFIINIDND
ncbi:MAG TPA: biopolymer transporter ExbD [Ignavibacteriales bacterium]|nr:biopolymer transporter ExbD [Ignavibacteriales bacterium]HOM64203.1 biopolymer transporter ExbD [Ignavibacteriales bacterium]HPD67324.1 biopolymer transporter ExbD [Ignavibacteriales bacterium]HRR19413.1 biopolymer transporter ExbD [Ignavibacteriales bacterium]HRT99854.1 biopolymer transporter ExbD [Ignavibacteriales bacterium]